MNITNHRFDDHWFGLSKDVGGTLSDLRFIVMHYTAGGDGVGTRDYFMKSPEEKGKNGEPVYASAHLLVDRDGTTWQLVPFNKKARHAGRARVAE
jgi:N-acetylmuramoyl-L-alanine amidase